MNFFEEQDRARRNTLRLVTLLILAVASLIALTVFAIAALLAVTDETGEQGLLAQLDPGLVAGIAAVIIGVVLIGTWYKWSQLRHGGAAVAEMLGGRLINSNTQDAAERRALNVVEEMAIASGMSVPPVYVLEDEAINAFAAGHTPQDAVIGVTRGCIRLLSRNELQGVIAHEFSHIFHGDMRLNLRLVALLHGILVIGLVGREVLYSMRYSGRSASRNSNNNNGAAALLAIGAGLVVVGYAGTFFGNIIKSAVSRQREFLADASAVQFTRDPSGIGGALKKIGSHLPGARLQAHSASEFSHMYFGEGVKAGFSSLFATHPPLEARIRRVEPGWDGRYPRVAPVAFEAEAAVSEEGGRRGRFAVGGPVLAAAVDAAIASVGQPQRGHLDYARDTLAALDPQLREAAHDLYSSRLVLYGILLSRDVVTRRQQLLALERVGADLPDAVSVLMPKLDAMDARFRLPLIELALPMIKQLSAMQHGQFIDGLNAIIDVEGGVDMMEWALSRIVLYDCLAPPAGTPRVRLAECVEEVVTLLSALARAGHVAEADAEAAFNAAAATLPFAVPGLLAAHAANTQALDKAVGKLSRLKPLEKPMLLKSMAASVEHAGEITPVEMELFRAVADAIDCPMPPLLADES
ncbi:hypothetical protein CAI21_20975 [Alkalilimnicola ehrlichii]|uniref:Peptidase M48 domain-containing protein n=1 Tax=Alkalilimnicola ehrlichii TaxID=351052 RepID=A0A3E0WIN3_9GAMM|nr:M48 family metallopeptidase [Alkalilimnicola ehrlichii]RFA24628.1 hypothetical protein CAI21_20975 [Alkalilimnicola ehrlichii]RFA31725.1 hypothetical protein CAL65_21575 [Alkalilimnicola ehrlichii]